MSAKPRVLLVVGFLWGDEGIVRGLIALAKGLMESGWEVCLASAMVDQDGYERFTRGPEWIESQGIQHFYVPFPNFRTPAGKFSTAFKALLSLNVAVQQFKPDIINVHSLSLCPYTFVMRSLYGIPYISTARTMPSANRLGVKFGGLINKYFNTFLGNRFIAISTEIKEAYERILRIPPGQIRVVYHGVETDRFRPPSTQERLESREAFGLNLNDKVVCLIGYLYPLKGHDVLIQAISLLKSEGVNVVALCAGAGDKEEVQTLQTQAEQSNVSDLIRLLGFTDARQVLWASDALILPSRLEGFGWVIPEAMLCGVVPIRTPAGGAIDQIENGINGFIFPFNDAEALAMRLKQLIENEALMSQMSVAAIESARQKFTAERMIKETIAVYEELMTISSAQ